MPTKALSDKAMRSVSKLKATVVAVVVTVGIAAVAGAIWFHDYPVRNFGVVREGVLYRSAQPHRLGWKRLRGLYGIRTVIDLREETPNKPWAVLERQFCARNGIRYIKLPIGPDRLTYQQLRTIAETICDPARRPVLVHCEHGKSRTGVVVAAYRIVAQGWSYRAALAESRKFKKNMKPGYARYLKELAKGRGWRRAGLENG